MSISIVLCCNFIFVVVQVSDFMTSDKEGESVGEEGQLAQVSISTLKQMMKLTLLHQSCRT